MKIRSTITGHPDWTEAKLAQAFGVLCDADPRLLALARVIERHVAREPERGAALWFGVYRSHAFRLARRLNGVLHSALKGRACELAEDYLLRLLIEHRADRALPLPPVKSELDKKALRVALPAPQQLDPYAHTLHVLSLLD